MGITRENPKVFNFECQHFKTWRMRMEFLLKVLRVLYVLNTDCPEQFRHGPVGTYQNDQWKSVDFDCRNKILNHLDNSLYIVFAKYKTANDLWEALEKEYATKDAGTKKYAVEKFLNLKMAKTKSVIAQVRDFQKIILKVQAEGMNIPKQFVVGRTMHELPPS